jgi:hypothetical protein
MDSSGEALDDVSKPSMLTIHAPISIRSDITSSCRGVQMSYRHMAVETLKIKPRDPDFRSMSELWNKEGSPDLWGRLPTLVRAVSARTAAAIWNP